MGNARDDGSAGQEWTRLGLIAACLLAAILAGLLVGTFGSGEIAGSPLDRALPGEEVYHEYLEEPADGQIANLGYDDSGLGALNPGDQTGVGGELQFDNETFALNDTAIHFIVESSQPTYWRTGSFDTYTGTGWERSTETDPYEEPLQYDGIVGDRVEYEVELQEPASSLPVPWQPTAISGLDDLGVTEDGAIEPASPLESGATFSGVSHKPENDPALLRTAGTDYPDELYDQYTQVPSDTPNRVEQFTDQLTADTDNPFDTAMAIQDWLRAEKDYSLDAAATGPDMADEFIFEMDAGYCENFATAMTMMLRTQDIPARYVVGYTPGQHVGEDTYEVRAMNAHAWVEVYFEGFGWIKFEPTPGDERLATEQAALQEEDPTAEHDAREPGSPGETFEPGNITDDNGGSDPTPPDPGNGDPGGDPGNGTGDPSDDGTYQTSLNATPIPGEPIEVTVTLDGDPAVGVGVSFNGEHVGVTNIDGTVTATVPYEDELRVEVHDEPGSFSEVDRIEPVGVDATMFDESSTPGDDRQGLVPGAPSKTASNLLHAPRPDQRLLGTATLSETTEDIYDVETDAEIRLSGEQLPGHEITLTALIEDVPVRYATVTVDGDVVGETNEAGRLTLTLPEGAGNTTIAVEREVISGDVTIELPELSVTVEPDAPIALPFTTATVEATYENTSAAGAIVTVDGEPVTTTDSQGTAVVRLPLTSEATIAVEQAGVADQETVDGILRNGALLASLLALLAGAMTYGYARTSRTPGDVLAALRRFPSTLVTMSTALVVTVATRSDVLLANMRDRLRRTGDHLVALLRGQTSVTGLLNAFHAWLTAKVTQLRHRVTNPDTTEDPGAEPVTIQTAWQEFLDYVSLEPTARTPGELADHAINEDGLPETPVKTMTNTFRAVEYGARSPSDRLEHVQQALDEIEASANAPFGTKPMDREEMNATA